jgi:hypothetical protein
MKYDQYGQTYTTSNELCDLLYKNPKLDISTEAVHKDLMLGKAVTKKSRKGKNFQAFRLLMNIKDFVNDITGQPTHQYTAKDREPQPEPTPKELLFSFE